MWVANDLDSTVTRIDPGTNGVRATIPVGDGPNGIAVAGGVVWVSNEITGSLTRIDPKTDTVVQTTSTGNRPEGVAATDQSLFVAVRGAGRPGGTLKVLDSGVKDDLTNLDPALAYSYGEWQLVTLTNDGLTGYRRVGGSAGTRVVPDLAVSLPYPRTAAEPGTFRLRRGVRYSNGAIVRLERHPLGHRVIVRPDCRRVLRAVLQRDRRRTEVPGGPREALRPVTRHRGRRRDELRHVPLDETRLGLPRCARASRGGYTVPAGTPLHPHGFVPATGPYEIASFSANHGARLVRNSRFHEWSRAAQPSGYPNVIVETVAGTPDSHVSAVLAGTADLAAQLNAQPPSPSTIQSIRTQHASLVEVNPWPITWYLGLNTRVPALRRHPSAPATASPSTAAGCSI